MLSEDHVSTLNASSKMGYQLKRLRATEFTRWLRLLYREDFLQRREDLEMITIKPPLQIRISPIVMDKLLDAYIPDEEIGGLLLSEPIQEEGKKSLQINRLKFLKNIADDPSSSYIPKELYPNMTKALRGTKGGLHYLPLRFHSHPKLKLPDQREMEYALARMWQLQTSINDREEAAQAYKISPLEIPLLLPRALVYCIEDEIFVGFYGGGIAPEDFKEYAMKLLGEDMIQKVTGIADWVTEDKKWWKAVLGVLGSIVVVFTYSLASLHPSTLMELAEIILSYREKTRVNTYFAFAKEGPIEIMIP